MSIRRIAIVAAATLGIGSGIAFAATLNVGSWHLWAGSQALTKGTCTVTGAANITDTYVDEKKVTKSYGGVTTALTSPSSGAREWAFFRFSLAGCAIPANGGADTATLKLVIQTTPGVSRTLTVTPVLSTWGGTLTWNQAQSLTYGSTTTTFSTGTAANATLSIPVTVDVDALIRNPSASYGWRISDAGAPSTGSDGSTLGSVEAAAAARPQLVINYAK